MDPNETLKMWVEAIMGFDHDAAAEAGDNLVGWLTRGGFEPDWSRYGLDREDFTSWHNTWVAQEVGLH